MEAVEFFDYTQDLALRFWDLYSLKNKDDESFDLDYDQNFRIRSSDIDYMKHSNQIFELLLNYEFSELFIGEIEFYKEIYEVNGYYVFGYIDASYFCIEIKNGCVVLVEEQTMNTKKPFIIAKCAKNDIAFIDALCHLFEYKIKIFCGEELDRNNYVASCVELSRLKDSDVFWRSLVT